MTAGVEAGPLLVLAPVGRDAQVIAGMLGDAGLQAKTLSGFAGPAARLEEGAGLIVTEEAFVRLDPQPLFDWIARQPAWSDFPIIMLRAREAPATRPVLGFIERLGKVTLLERPLHPITLVAAARSALRARARQREAAALLEERTRAAENLRESEARFRTLADSAPALIWVSDGRGRWLYANRRHEVVFGRPAESLLGEAWAETLHPDDREPVRGELARASAARSRWDAEFRIVDRAGLVRWLRCEAAPRTGSEPGLVGCSVDVTEVREAADALERRIADRTAELAAANRALVRQMEERREMERVLRQSQRMEAVGQLTAGVAHDFNNLLTVVIAGLDFLDRSVGPGQKRRLDMMRIAAERGAKLTSQLLAFSRRQKLEPKPVNLNEAVLALRDLLQSTIGGGYELVTEFEPEPWQALVDPTQIEMIILNLAINARDAMQVGGRLTVATANVVIDRAGERPEEPGPGEYVMVEVRDTGAGIAPDVLERVFEPFFTTKPVGKGSGLGLSQVLGFASQSGGGVRIETEIGKGTALKVYLPRAAAAEPSVDVRADRRAPPASRAGLRVLLVDDDDVVRESTAMLLRDLGYDVVAVPSGARALAWLDEDGRADAMVVDFAMPGMNGAEVARAAQARWPGLPILFVTGYADVSELRKFGDGPVLAKPFDAAALREQLGRVLARADGVHDGKAPFRGRGRRGRRAGLAG